MYFGDIKKTINVIFFCIILCLMQSTFAATASPLPADQAFSLSANFNHPKQVLVEWQIASGYYLYVKKMNFTFNPANTATVQMPQGEFQYDQARGRYEAFSGNVNIPVLLNSSAQTVEMKITYQGCSQDGFCYPPMQQILSLNVANQTITKIDKNNLSSGGFFSSLLNNQNNVANFLQQQQLGMTLLIFVGLGLLLALTPCVWPMVPILASIIVGQKERMNYQSAFLLSLTYVFGMALMYAIAGLIAASLGSSLQVWLQQSWIIIATGILFAILAFSLFGYYNLQLPQRLQNKIAGWNRHQQGGSYTGAFLMGAISTLIVSPCVTAPLIGVLMYIATTGNHLLGASALFAMGIGMGIPLLLIGTSTGKWLPKSGPWMELIKKFFGILMLAMAIWLLSRVVSPTIIFILCAMLIIFILMLFIKELINFSWWGRLGWLVGCSALISSFIVMSPINMVNGSFSTQQIKEPFVLVQDVADFKHQLQLAQNQQKPVMVDFYADWCESCVSMDKHVFRQPEIRQALTDFVLLRIDLSNNTLADETLLKYFNVIAPPTVLFYNTKGQELDALRIVGEINANEFLQRIRELPKT